GVKSRGRARDQRVAHRSAFDRCRVGGTVDAGATDSAPDDFGRAAERVWVTQRSGGLAWPGTQDRKPAEKRVTRISPSLPVVVLVDSVTRLRIGIRSSCARQPS